MFLMDIVAEGVETQVQRDIVHSLGIKYAQGWLFGRPVSLLEFYFNLLHQMMKDSKHGHVNAELKSQK